MTFMEKITGSDITKKFKEMQLEVDKLPKDYQDTWSDICMKIYGYSDFTGRNIMPIFDNILELMIEMNNNGKSCDEVFGNDIDSFCSELMSGIPSNDYRSKARKKLNKNIENRFGK